MEFIIVLFALIGAGYWVLLRREFLKEYYEEIDDNPVFLRITFAGSPESASVNKFYQDLHSRLLGGKNNLVSLESFPQSGGNSLLLVCDSEEQLGIEDLVKSNFPGVKLEQVKDYFPELLKNSSEKALLEFELELPFFIPLKFSAKAGIYSLFRNVGPDIYPQIIIRPVPAEWQDIARKAQEESSRRFTLDEKAAIDTKLKEVGYQISLRVVIIAKTETEAKDISLKLQQEMRSAISTELNNLVARNRETSILTKVRQRFIAKNLSEQLDGFEKFESRFLDDDTETVISVSELEGINSLD
jgi:hypothetical protein